MALLLYLLLGGVVLGIALYAVARASSRLSMTEGMAVFDLKHAVEWVSGQLPRGVEVPDEVIGRLLMLQVDYLRACGVATFGKVDKVATDAAERLGDVTLDEVDMETAVLKLAWDEGLEVDELDVVVVLDAHSGYLRQIGAIGGAIGPNKSGRAIKE